MIDQDERELLTLLLLTINTAVGILKYLQDKKGKEQKKNHRKRGQRKR